MVCASRRHHKMMYKILVRLQDTITRFLLYCIETIKQMCYIASAVSKTAAALCVPLSSALPLYHTVKAASVRTGMNFGLDFVCSMEDAAEKAAERMCRT